jgi:CTP:phosphocholine cytidylyltransferase-like protein
MTKHQFDILTAIEKSATRLTQREVAALTDLSLGTVNKTYNELSDEKMIENGEITQKGLEALEPYRAKRAVFIAAGFGSRLVPITLNTPKPLVRVHGKRLIDRSIEACLKAGIEEIYVVRGYLGEQFDQLLYTFPNIKFIDNTVYNETNNISSAVAAKDYLENAYVFEADLLLHNPDLIGKYQYTSNYLGVPVSETDDWCFHTKKNGQIVNIAVGGTNCYHMFGISYWNEKDGKRLAKDLPVTMSRPGGKEKFWDLCQLGEFKNNYDVYIRPCTFDDLAEIDTYNELKEIDPAYK